MMEKINYYENGKVRKKYSKKKQSQKEQNPINTWDISEHYNNVTTQHKLLNITTHIKIKTKNQSGVNPSQHLYGAVSRNHPVHRTFGEGIENSVLAPHEVGFQKVAGRFYYIFYYFYYFFFNYYYYIVIILNLSFVSRKFENFRFYYRKDEN